MKRKSSPGDFISYQKVESVATDEAYGAFDLVDLGLFYSEHFVRDAIRSGKLHAKKINKKSIVICKSDLLEYWRKFRKEEFEPANNSMILHFSISEVDTICRLVEAGKRISGSEFSKDDLIRNVVQTMELKRITVDENPHLFKLN